MENQTELYKIAAAYLHGFKKSKLKILLKRIGRLDSIFEYSYSKLENASGLSLDMLKKTEREKALKQAQLNLEFNQLHDIRSLFYTDNAYPYQLKEHKEVHIDRLFDSSQLHPSTIQSLLMQLELKNYILNSSGLFYSSRV